MSNPKGMRSQHIATGTGEAVHIYSRPGTVILQLRREVPTEQDPRASSYKVALELTAGQALAVAAELLTAAQATLTQAEKPAAPTAGKP